MLCNILSNATSKVNLINCEFILNIAENGDDALSIHACLRIEWDVFKFTRSKLNKGYGLISIETNFISKNDTTEISPHVEVNLKITFIDCSIENENANINGIYIF